MQNYDCDVVIIGGGVIGCAVARELSRYDLTVMLLERSEDVCSGTSKANSAIIHAGYDAMPGTRMAKMNVEGNRMMDALSEALCFPFIRNGSLVLCLSEADMPALRALYERGLKNGVPDLCMLSGDEAKQMEPNISENTVAALYAPTGGIVCPFEMTIALAENALENGVDFRFLHEVTGIERWHDGYRLTVLRRGERSVRLNSGGANYRVYENGGETRTVTAKYVVNAAGVYADRFHNSVSGHKISITARRGVYCLFDKESGDHVRKTVFRLPGKYGKGVLVTPTVHGNLLIGPTANDIGDKEETRTTAEELAEAMDQSSSTVRNILYHQVITSFAGLRAHEAGQEFILGEPADAPGFFDAAGMESPGLSSAPAVGAYLADAVAKAANAKLKTHFQAKRTGIPRMASLDDAARAERIAQRPDYAAIVCRCENISEGEIADSIARPLGARSLDGIKRRVRQGMGRCQAGFCTPKAMEILSRLAGIPMSEIRKNDRGSKMLAEFRK